MKAFYYAPEHVGMSEFPPGYFQLGGFVPTVVSDGANCFVLPCDIRHVTNGQILALPYLAGNEARHVFFSLGEFPQRALPVDSISIRTDFNKQLQATSSRGRVWCWGVDDLGSFSNPSSTTFQFDIHAQMWASAEITDIAVKSCIDADLKVHDQRNNFFYGTLETNEDPRLADLRASFLQTMSLSRLVLVPRSRACVNRYRFFEAMSMGRVPVLLCDDCLLPLADRINYDWCSLRLHEHDAHLTGVYLREWLRTHDDADILSRGAYGRAMWQTWLANPNWERTWGILVKEQLEAQHVFG